MNIPCLIFRDDLDLMIGQDMTAGLGVALLHGAQNGENSIDAIHLRLAARDLRLSRRVLPLYWSLSETIPEDPVSQAIRFSEEFSARDVVVAYMDRQQPDRAGVCAVKVGDKTLSMPCQLVETGPGAFTRNHAVLESHALHERCATIIGLGSGGAYVVDALARSGVGRFVLWDNDRLEPHNIGRHVLTLHDAGRKKVLAMRDHVLSINPSAEVRVVDADVMDHCGPSGLLAEAVAASDVIIGSTDSNPSRFAINEVAWNAGRPALFGRAFKRACGGDVIQVVPERDMPCYACHVEARVVDEEVSSTRDKDRVAYADTVVPIEPGLTLDIAPISAFLARLALMHLCRETTGLGPAAAELDAPLYLWANRREEQFASWEPMRRSHDRLSVLRWYGIGVAKNPECSVCRCSN